MAWISGSRLRISSAVREAVAGIVQLRDQRRQPGVVRQFADGVQVGAGSGIQLHRLIGLTEPVDGARQVLHGVIVARQRAMPRGAARRHLEARRNLLRRLDLEDGHARGSRQNVRVLVERELGVDLRPRMLHDPRGAQRSGLFVRLGKQNDVAIEHDFAPVQIHHHGQFGGEQLLVVLGPASVDVAVLFDGCQRIHRPLRAISGHHIAVRDQQQRTLLAGAAQARHEVETLRDRRRAVRRECPRGRPPASGIARRASRCREDSWCPGGSTPAGSAPPDRQPSHPSVQTRLPCMRARPKQDDSCFRI